jgi:hypothetical protein
LEKPVSFYLCHTPDTSHVQHFDVTTQTICKARDFGFKSVRFKFDCFREILGPAVSLAASIPSALPHVVHWWQQAPPAPCVSVIGTRRYGFKDPDEERIGSEGDIDGHVWRHRGATVDFGTNGSVALGRVHRRHHFPAWTSRRLAEPIFVDLCYGPGIIHSDQPQDGLAPSEADALPFTVYINQTPIVWRSRRQPAAELFVHDVAFATNHSSQPQDGMDI